MDWLLWFRLNIKVGGDNRSTKENGILAQIRWYYYWLNAEGLVPRVTECLVWSRVPVSQLSTSLEQGSM